MLKEKNRSRPLGGWTLSIKESAASEESGGSKESASKESLFHWLQIMDNPINHPWGRWSCQNLNLKRQRKFNGNIEDWPEFWDSFCSAIHSDEKLAKVAKFKYLRSYLEGSTGSVIKDTYRSWLWWSSCLTGKRFAKPVVIRIAHINELLNLAPVFNEKSVQRLRSFNDET